MIAKGRKALSHSTRVGILTVVLSVFTTSLLSTLAIAKKPDVDVVLEAMHTELKRSQTGLQFEDYPAPYFIGYQIKDLETADVTARRGALYSSPSHLSRQMRVEVRVGSYKQDSSDDQQGPVYEELTLYQPGTTLPIDDHVDALRSALWLLTDQVYKESLTAFLRVKGQQIYRIEDAERHDSFSREKVYAYRDKIKRLTFDRGRWEKTARKLSERVSQNPKIFDAEVNVEGRHEIRYQINTEGSEIVTSTTLYGVHVKAYALAEDGMLLDHSLDLYGPSEKVLSSKKELYKAVDTMVEELLALRKAPVLDPFTGPVILEPRASGVFFHEAVGHRLEGHRQADEEEGRTFAGQLGKSVLPDFLSVYDDPTILDEGGGALNGAYLYDDEGIPAQRVTLVKKGKLMSYLMRRKPVKGAAVSNGHGRAQGVSTPVARMGNLFVVSEKRVSATRLKEMLLEEVRKQGKSFGLIVGDITGGSTNTMTYGYQAFKGNARMVYRVDGQTGETTLVRGVEIVGTPLSSINKIVAAGEDNGVFNGYCGAESGYVPVSTIAPALLFRELEMQRSGRTKQRAPILKAPSQDQGN
jgi:TldD protein